MRRTHSPLLLALALLLGGSVSIAEAQPAQCPMDAWLRAGGAYTSVQGVPRGVWALGSPFDRIALFQALGGHERGVTDLGSSASQLERQDPTTIVGTDAALVVRIEGIPNSVDGAGLGPGVQLRAVNAERCMSFSLRVTRVEARDSVVDSTTPTR